MNRLLFLLTAFIAVLTVARADTLFFPPALSEGDTIAIVSPSGIASASNINATARVLRDEGWEVEIGPHALARHDYYAGTDAQRLADLKAALTDPSVRTVLCGRGGFGAVRLLDSIAELPLESDPKWLVGFSDITALHCLLTSRGIASIHGHMTSHIARGADDPDTQAFFDILRGYGVSDTIPANPRNRPGEAQGTLVGGNLSVLTALIGTPYDVIKPGVILFIEDLGEPLYRFERMLWQIKLSGGFDNLAGLIVGKFRDVTQKGSTSVEQIVQKMTGAFNYPVAYDFPIGHVSHNIPVICGADATLIVTPSAVYLYQP